MLNKNKKEITDNSSINQTGNKSNKFFIHRHFPRWLC